MSQQHSQDTYQVIARKYRPQTFEDVVGQEPVVTTLKNAIKFHRLAHAYLFCGCRGTGKTTLARVFAKALNCYHLSENFEPCNKCLPCQEIAQARSLDVIEIDGASHRGIDDIRQINETIGYAPSSGKFKIYIIDEVHMLTKEAFNALLKTLEEPPENVKFFFATTEPHKVLSTIMSRCQRFDLQRIPFQLIQDKLKKIAIDLNVQVEDEALQLLAKLSEGSLRDAESLFDQVICYNEGILSADKVSHSLGIVSQTTFFELDMAVDDQDFSHAFTLAEKIFSSGKDLHHFLDSLVEHYRTILAFQLKQPPELSVHHTKKYAHSASSTYSQEQCLYILDYLLGWLQQVTKSTFKRINLEMILLHLIRSKQRIPVDVLVKRLHELSKLLPSSDNPISTIATPLEIKQKENSSICKAPPPRTIEDKALDRTVIEDTSKPSTMHEESSKVESLIESNNNQAKISEENDKITDVKLLDEDVSTPQTRSTALDAEKIEAILSDHPKDSSPKAEVMSQPSQPITDSAVKSSGGRPLQKPQIRHETVIRFATVELEGVFAKN
jgi:DNA polymerase-3 subunit gamma/tau